MKPAIATTTLRASPPPPSATPPLAALATPAAPDRAPEQNAATARRFADLLRAQRSNAAAAPAPTTPTPPSAINGGAPGENTHTEDVADPVEAPTQASARPSTPGAKPRTPGARQATAKSSVENTAAPTKSDEREGGNDHARAVARSAADGSRALAALAAQVAPRDVMEAGVHDVDGRAPDEGDASAGDAVRWSDALGADATNAFRAHGTPAVQAAGERIVATAGHDAPAIALHGDTTFASALGMAAVTAEPAHGTRAPDAMATAVASSPVTAIASEARDAAASATTVALATTIDSPEFAAALGVQVSVLARDGVQHAELHLRPIETGPVSIRIEVDGTTARIDFGADLAATRHAIERGLPELASALRDAGLTLTGGGVSQHAGSRAGGGDGSSDAGARPTAGATPAATAPAVVGQRRSGAGGLDVYA
ncbi:MAG: flagellar hook-length control protein FliK [Rhizobacter sp.]|nr:flagellar hook-length control protein FliK [Rhizobacter sp.]